MSLPISDSERSILRLVGRSLFFSSAGTHVAAGIKGGHSLKTSTGMERVYIVDVKRAYALQRLAQLGLLDEEPELITGVRGGRHRIYKINPSHPYWLMPER